MDPKRTKLGPRGIRCAFIGYAPNNKAYRLLNLESNHRVERSQGSFLRRFRLPENAKVNDVKAAMENGVLTVTVPKEEVKKPDVKPIQITG
ncbi:hypothetical protein KIW84_021204 [Lathyrus oleraceus]|uniref:SHSP domain-containing protein n=1 Tax=Pisum sativum TaxID=3888 RepID=A0A9D5B531_PEA|nr:hypothetical protein KIW84_021204 [Pisum sativum]